MPAKNPRISAVVEHDILEWLRLKAGEQGVSVSLVVRDMLRRLRDEDEERYWATSGEERLETFDRETAVSHGDAWS